MAFCVQLKAKEEEKVQTAKAKVQKLKAEVEQRKALRGKRVPTAYILFLKDHIKTVSHLPSTQRFKVRICGAQACLEHILTCTYPHMQVEVCSLYGVQAVQMLSAQYFSKWLASIIVSQALSCRQVDLKHFPGLAIQ